MKEKKEVKKSKFLSEDPVSKHIEIFIIGFLIVGVICLLLQGRLFLWLLFCALWTLIYGFPIWIGRKVEDGKRNRVKKQFENSEFGKKLEALNKEIEKIKKEEK